jgi:hypothetical protein
MTVLFYRKEKTQMMMVGMIYNGWGTKRFLSLVEENHLYHMKNKKE